MICKQKLYKTMDALGYPESLSGTRYIQSAVSFINAKWGRAMTKEIYPAIGRAAGITPAAVERAMRTATEAAMRSPTWTKEWREIGGWNQPTNAEVVYRLERECRVED